MVGIAHVIFQSELEFGMKTELKVALPILLLGLAHSIITTMEGTMVNKLTTDKSQIPQVFSNLKIFSSIHRSLCCYINGHIR